MAQKHPGGKEITLQLLKMADLSPCKILDMGAGDGATVHLLHALGYEVLGIDQKAPHPPNDLILQGDFCNLDFPDNSYDAIISECAFYISQHIETALLESFRILKPKGRLLLADVSFDSQEVHLQRLQQAGFTVTACTDITPLWREYYISCIWDGTLDEAWNCPKKGKCSYFLTVCKKNA